MASDCAERLSFKGEGALMVTIFIIDDEAILHRLYKDVFAIKGHQVVADAYDGEEAVHKFMEMDPKPDVIILDHRMPNKDGLEAMKEMLKIEPDARIVFISADANVRDQAIKSGAASFGLKPVTIRHMLDLVESATVS
jgi:two-component system chemotaxis response regulator CheY